MRRFKLGLFGKVLVTMILIFGVVATIVSAVAAYGAYTTLTAEFRSKGTAIATSVASSSVELLLNHDGSQIQSTIDQFAEIRGVAYVFVEDENGEIFGHTFVPTVPPEIHSTLLGRASHELHEQIEVKELEFANGDNVIDVAAPVLAGVAGTVHVGMARAVINAEIIRAVLRIQLVLLAVMAVSAAVAYVLVNRLVEPARVLTKHVRRVTVFDLDTLKPDPLVAAVAEKSTDEFGHLARAFQEMELQLVQALRTRDELVGVKKELDIAGSIQQALLPKALSAGEIAGRFDIDAVMIAAKEVGGDFYDYFLIDRDHIGFVVGDVSGKGVAASLYMAVCRTLLRATALQGVSPSECLRTVNDRLCSDTDSSLFVTVTYAILDTSTGELKYATGGHPPPIVIAESGLAAEMKKAPGTVLGMMEDLEFGEERITLMPGEWLVLYSDGISEAMNPRQELYGEDRLVHFLGLLRAATAAGANHAIVAEVRKFADTAPQADDITVLSLIYRGPGAGA